jgi:hypothetical protein
MIKLGLLLLLATGLQAFGQQPVKLQNDTLIRKRLKNIIETYRKTLKDANRDTQYLDICHRIDAISQKIDFVDEAVEISYYGGGKSGTERKNELIAPVNSLDRRINDLLDRDKVQHISLSQNILGTIDAVLDSIYNTAIKNKDKGKDISGDDDENRLVQVEVKVYETFAGKREIPGFKVFCDNPFLPNSREDFNPTLIAKRMIKAGYWIFHINRGNLKQDQMFRIVYGDPNTHLILFSKEESTIKK